MLDRKKIEDSYRETLRNECLDLSEREVRLISYYRRMPDPDQEYLCRIAKYLVPSDND